MCVSCGCDLPNNDYGDSRNITADKLVAAGVAASQAQKKTVTARQVATNVTKWAKTQPKGK